MANVIPSASPLWERNIDYTQLGGHAEKQNRLGVYTHNPKTDISAQEFSSLVDTVARMSWTAPFAMIHIDGYTTVQYVGMNGVGESFAPTVAVVAGGVNFTWETSYDDSYGVSANTLLRGAIVTVNTATGSATADITGTNTVSVYLTGTDEFTLVVW
jgi:hypothetical protein